MINQDVEETLVMGKRVNRVYEVSERLVNFLEAGEERVTPAELLAAFALATAGIIVSFPSVEGNPLKAFDLAKAHNELFAKTLSEMLLILVREQINAKASEA